MAISISFCGVSLYYFCANAGLMVVRLGPLVLEIHYEG